MGEARATRNIQYAYELLIIRELQLVPGALATPQRHESRKWYWHGVGMDNIMMIHYHHHNNNIKVTI